VEVGISAAHKGIPIYPHIDLLRENHKSKEKNE